MSKFKDKLADLELSPDGTNRVYGFGGAGFHRGRYLRPVIEEVDRVHGTEARAKSQPALVGYATSKVEGDAEFAVVVLGVIRRLVIDQCPVQCPVAIERSDARYRDVALGDVIVRCPWVGRAAEEA